MSIRVQVILSEPDWELFRHQASVEGLSLSAWFREAAHEWLKKSHAGPSIRSVKDLQAFFEACDERESGQEPDWDEHLRVISQSKRAGDSGT
jgi:hypothetical protein